MVLIQFKFCICFVFLFHSHKSLCNENHLMDLCTLIPKLFKAEYISFTAEGKQRGEISTSAAGKCVCNIALPLTPLCRYCIHF